LYPGHDYKKYVKYENFGLAIALKMYFVDFRIMAVYLIFIKLFEGTSAIVLNTEESSRNFLQNICVFLSIYPRENKVLKT